MYCVLRSRLWIVDVATEGSEINKSLLALTGYFFSVIFLVLLLFFGGCYFLVKVIFGEKKVIFE